MHQGFTVWFTACPVPVKTTVGRLLDRRLRASGAGVEVLDGDIVRTRLSRGLGFSKDDRDEIIRRIGFVCELLSRDGLVAIAAVISACGALREEIEKPS